MDSHSLRTVTFEEPKRLVKEGTTSGSFATPSRSPALRILSHQSSTSWSWPNRMAEQQKQPYQCNNGIQWPTHYLKIKNQFLGKYSATFNLRGNSFNNYYIETKDPFNKHAPGPIGVTRQCSISSPLTSSVDSIFQLRSAVASFSLFLPPLLGI